MRMNQTIAVAILLSLFAVPGVALGDPFDDRIQGPREQLSATGSFGGDTFFKRPSRAASSAFSEPRQTVPTGLAMIESISGTVLLPRGQHLLEAQLVAGYQDPVRTEVLATLDWRLIAVTPEGSYFTLHLRGPVVVNDLSAFSVLVLRDAAGAANNGDKAEVAVTLSYVIPTGPK